MYVCGTEGGLKGPWGGRAVKYVSKYVCTPFFSFSSDVPIILLDVLEQRRVDCSLPCRSLKGSGWWTFGYGPVSEGVKSLPHVAGSGSRR